MWVGVDDTDSPKGGCTTYVLTEIVRTANALGWDLIGLPRLVRLNPNVPWKTRGNAALAARFGRGRGAARSIGHGPDGPVRAFERGEPIPETQSVALAESLWEVVLRESRDGDANSDPALVATRRPLPAPLYWEAVRTVVSVDQVADQLRAVGAYVRASGSGRGVVGAAAAIAWRGAHPTWELIAYRTRERLAEQRVVDRASVRSARRAHPSLFLCSDDRTRRLLVAPHTPCPILYGLRSTREGPLYQARRRIRSEPVERWLVFRTNQGTGDHLPRVGVWSPNSAVHLRGAVAGHPVVLGGGHVRFPLRAGSFGLVPCVAFEPTKTLGPVARRLWPGDRVRVWGGSGRQSVVHVEGIELLSAVPRIRLAPPSCRECGSRTESLGRGRGYRCSSCRSRWPPESSRRVIVAQAPELGTYHPTPSARRHLHPLGPENDGVGSPRIPK